VKDTVGAGAGVPAFARRGEHRPWLVATVAAALGLVAWRLGMSRSDFVDHGQFWLGVVAAALVVAAMAFSLRKRRHAARLGRLRPWYLAHLWCALLGGLGGWLHAGGAHGPFYLALAATAIAAWVSGLLFLAWQEAQLRLLGREPALPVLRDDLEVERDRLGEEMASLVGGLDPGPAAAVWAGAGRPRPGWLALGALGADEGLRREAIRGRLLAAAPGGGEERQAALTRLAEDAARLERVEAALALQRGRSLWLTVHVVAAVPALVLVAVHLLLVWRY
jgi:hypothetical protein